jgi:hypothetical protein
MKGRLTPMHAAALLVAFILGGIAGVAAELLLRDTGTNPSSETLALLDTTLEGTGTGPLAVQALIVRLPEGFEQERTPERPTLVLVERGRVEIENAAGEATYIAGTSFLAPGGEPYTIRVTETAEIATIDLGPAGSA